LCYASEQFRQECHAASSEHSKEHVISAEVASILNLKGTVGKDSMAMDIGRVPGVEASHLSD